MCLKQSAKVCDGKGLLRMLPRWLRGSGSVTHPWGLSHWPGMSQLEKADTGLGHSVSTAHHEHMALPRQRSQWENHLVPLCPYSYKTHFPLDLLRRSPLPPPLCSFCPHPTILTCWGIGCAVCRVAQMPTELWPCLKSSPAPPVLQSSPRQTGRSFP